MKWKFAIILSLVIFSSCATYKTKIEAPHSFHQAPNSNTIIHSCYLIGDAGYSNLNQLPFPIKEMYKTLANENENSSLFFLGDNVYENGIAEPGHVEEVLSRHRLQVQIDLAKSFKGRSFFIPGNHDWGFGKEALLRQQHMVEGQLSDEAFMPDGGCPGPDLIELGENIVAIAFDSEWYLGEWPSDQNLNKECHVDSRQKLLIEIEQLIKQNQEKTIIIAMHHPLFSYGPHGGYYSTIDHIFPLSPIIYLPLPIIGSLVALIRRNINRHQDLGHSRYKTLRSNLLEMTKDLERVLFVSGHEHTQQWIKKGKRHFIVSGSGSKTDAARLGDDSLFATGRPGYCAIDFYKTGEAWIRFYSIEEKGQSAQLILHSPVFGVSD